LQESVEKQTINLAHFIPITKDGFISIDRIPAHGKYMDFIHSLPLTLRSSMGLIPRMANAVHKSSLSH
jgi:hypothetical protein